MKRTSCPAARSRVSVCLPHSSSTSAIVPFAPASRKRVRMTRLMPPAAPETITTRPSKSPTNSLPFCRSWQPVATCAAAEPAAGTRYNQCTWTVVSCPVTKHWVHGTRSSRLVSRGRCPVLPVADAQLGRPSVD